MAVSLFNGMKAPAFFYYPDTLEGLYVKMIVISLAGCDIMNICLRLNIYMTLPVR
jgi:hypothetical protein